MWFQAGKSEIYSLYSSIVERATDATRADSNTVQILQCLLPTAHNDDPLYWEHSFIPLPFINHLLKIDKKKKK